MAVPDYVFFGSTAWDTPWLTEHNLAHALAREHRVLFVEPPVTPASPFRYGLGSRTGPALRSLAHRTPRTRDGVEVFAPVAMPPLENPRARELSAPLLRRQLGWVRRHLGLRDPAVVAARDIVDVRGALGESSRLFLVKDWVEGNSELLGVDAATLAAEREAMCGASDVTVAISPQLQEVLAAHGCDSELLRHGFHAELAPLYDEAAPADVAALPRPLLVYAGRIDGRLDFRALASVAARYSQGSLVLIGPRSPRLPGASLAPLERLHNVRFLGARSRTRLPAYLAAADCTLLPYASGDWQLYGSPLKLWDYLYAGPPLAGSGYVALRDYPPPLAHFASEPERLGDAIAAALTEAPEGRAARRRFALDNSWERRAEELDRIVTARTPSQAAGASGGRRAA